LALLKFQPSYNFPTLGHLPWRWKLHCLRYVSPDLPDRTVQ